MKTIFEKFNFFDRRKGILNFEPPIENSFFVKFQNYRRNLVNSSFEREFYNEKRLINFFMKQISDEI